MRLFLFSVLFAFSVAAAAAPIIYNSTIYSTSAFAEIGDQTTAFDSESSPPDLLPITSAAVVLGTDPSLHEVAVGFGTANDGSLTISNLIAASQSHAGSVAEASYQAEIIGNGRYRLVLDFDTVSTLLGATADQLLGVAFSFGASTLFDESFTASGRFIREFDLAQGGLGVLNISLIGVADADIGVGFAKSSVEFAISEVPLPAAAWMLGSAMGGLAMVRRRRVQA